MVCLLSLVEFCQVLLGKLFSVDLVESIFEHRSQPFQLKMFGKLEKFLIRKRQLKQSSLMPVEN